MIKKFLSCCFGNTPKTYPSTLSEYETLCLLIEKVNECISQVNELTEIVNSFSGELVDGSVTTTKIADLAVTEPKLADGAVSTIKIAKGAVATEKLSDGAVTQGKIANFAVTQAKIADGAVYEEKLTGGAVTTQKIAYGAVTDDRIADEAVTTNKLANGSVNTNKIADGAITAVKLAQGVHTYFDQQYVKQIEGRGLYARDYPPNNTDATVDKLVKFSPTDGQNWAIVQRNADGKIDVSDPTAPTNPVPLRLFTDLQGIVDELQLSFGALADRVEALEQA